MAESDFGEHYESHMQEFYGDGRIHVSAAWRDPRMVKKGEFVMYLPLEITEGANMIPRIAKVTKAYHEKGTFIIVTHLGVMTFRQEDKVQVVT